MKGPSGVANVRDYGCAKVLRLLDSYLAGELTVETNHEILEHVARCHGCAGELGARERLRASVRRVSARLADAPSSAFEERLRALLAHTPPRRRVPVPAALVAAAVLCGAAGLAVVAYRGLQRPAAGIAASSSSFDAGALPAAARTQTSCALRYDWRAKALPVAQLQERLGAPYAAALPAIARRLRGYTLAAAHRCGHGGRAVVHLVFAKDGDPTPSGLVSAIVMPKRGPLPPSRFVLADHLRSEAGEALPVAAARESGYDLSSVELADSVVFVVSSRGPRETLELSRAILPALVTAAVR